MGEVWSGSVNQKFSTFCGLLHHLSRLSVLACISRRFVYLAVPGTVFAIAYHLAHCSADEELDAAIDGPHVAVETKLSASAASVRDDCPGRGVSWLMVSGT